MVLVSRMGNHPLLLQFAFFHLVLSAIGKSSIKEHYVIILESSIESKISLLFRVMDKTARKMKKAISMIEFFHPLGGMIEGILLNGWFRSFLFHL